VSEKDAFDLFTTVKQRSFVVTTQCGVYVVVTRLLDDIASVHVDYCLVGTIDCDVPGFSLSSFSHLFYRNAAFIDVLRLRRMVGFC